MANKDIAKFLRQFQEAVANPLNDGKLLKIGEGVIQFEEVTTTTAAPTTTEAPTTTTEPSS